MSELTLEQAIELLRNCVKKSTSLDQFPHIDLSLVPASKQARYQEALKLAYAMIKKGEIGQEEFNQKLFA